MSLSELESIHPIEKYVNMELCKRYGVTSFVLHATRCNASTMRFDTKNDDHGSPCFLRLTNTENDINTTIGMGVKDFRFILQTKYFPSKKELITLKWITNHYEFIVWKLASMERKFPRFLGGRYCNREMILYNLKKRFQKEIMDVNRPAIRMILNRDVSSLRLMILCVSQILPGPNKNKLSSSEDQDKHSNNNNRTAVSSSLSNDHIVKLEVTDGWYSVPAILDEALSSFVHSGRITIGSKIVTCGAILLGCEEGIDPLDDSYCSYSKRCPVALKLTANSTRLAKWNAKLGFVVQNNIIVVASLSLRNYPA